MDDPMFFEKLTNKIALWGESIMVNRVLVSWKAVLEMRWTTSGLSRPSTCYLSALRRVLHVGDACRESRRILSMTSSLLSPCHIKLESISALNPPSDASSWLLLPLLPRLCTPASSQFELKLLAKQGQLGHGPLSLIVENVNV